MVKTFGEELVEPALMSLSNVNGTLYFQANDGINGIELWKSNGTTTGTVLVADINPGTPNSGSNGMTVMNSTLFFSANDGVNGVEPWSLSLTPLPVELIDFTGRNEKIQNLLFWKTATETNNKGFDIETSKDGVNFQSLEFVKGRGTTSETQNYTFTHRLTANESGVLYYRLKQMDTNVQFEYSKTIAIRSEGKKNSIAVYPNPSNGLYTIVPNEKDEIEQISLMSITGQSIDVNISNNQLDLSNEPNGVYFLQVNGQNIRLIKN